MTLSPRPIAGADPFRQRAQRALRTALTFLALAFVGASPALLSSCGGVGTGGTGSFGAGPITGFGSIFVAGVEFFDGNAQVTSDDGDLLTNRDLKLGATVTVTGDALAAQGANASANASRITLSSEIIGPVSVVNATAGGLVVLGQPVRVLATTVFDPRLPDGLRSVAAGRILQVYALYDPATSTYRATRIEPLDGALQWRLRGPIESVDTTAKTLKMGDATIRYGAAKNVPEDLLGATSTRRVIRLRLAGSTDPQGKFTALSFASPAEPLADVQEARVGGLVTAVESVSRFSIGGVSIDASAATIQGASRLKVGAEAQARGPAVNGVIQATLVLLPTDSPINALFFNAPVLSIDRAAQTLVLQVVSGNVTIWYGRPVPDELALLPLGSQLDRLQPGVKLRVRAVQASNRLEATLINFE